MAYLCSGVDDFIYSRIKKARVSLRGSLGGLLFSFHFLLFFCSFSELKSDIVLFVVKDIQRS